MPAPSSFQFFQENRGRQGGDVKQLVLSCLAFALCYFNVLVFFTPYKLNTFLESKHQKVFHLMETPCRRPTLEYNNTIYRTFSPLSCIICFKLSNIIVSKHV